MRLSAFVGSAVLFWASRAAAFDAPEKLYILSSHGDDMTVVDTATDKILGTVKEGKDPHGIAAPLSQDVLYIATENDDSLAVIDPVKDAVLATYPIFGKRPNEIEVTPDGRFVYVPCLGAGEYQVFDTKEKKIVAKIKTDGFPHNVVGSPDGRWMYLSPYDRGRNTEEWAKKAGLPTALNRKLWVADTKTHTIAWTLELPSAPRPIALDPKGRRLYINTDDYLGFLVVDVVERKLLHEVP